MDDQDEGSRRIYITREISRREGRKFGRHQEVLLVEYLKRRRRIHPQTRPENGPGPSPQLRRWWSCPPMILLDRWRSPHKDPVLKPASLPNSLYWAYWVWVCSHLQWKTPPNWDPIGLIFSNGFQLSQQVKNVSWWYGMLLSKNFPKKKKKVSIWLN